MDQVSQQNAALVEQSAAASNAMHEQAGQLMEAVSVFKLAEASEIRGEMRVETGGEVRGEVRAAGAAQGALALPGVRAA